MQTSIDTTAQLLAALTRQNDLLTQILESLNKPELGLLTTSPGTIRVYCNRDRCPGALWYTLNEAREPVALPAKAIRGFVQNLRFEQTERRGKEVWKVYTLLDCGKVAYELESGLESVFTRGLLMSLASMESSELQQAIAVGVAAGDDESVLLCRVWRPDNSPVFGKWDDQTDWRAVAQAATSNVKAAVGV